MGVTSLVVLSVQNIGQNQTSSDVVHGKFTESIYELVNDFSVQSIIGICWRYVD
jgi:hypothetical protein